MSAPAEQLQRLMAFFKVADQSPDKLVQPASGPKPQALKTKPVGAVNTTSDEFAKF